LPTAALCALILPPILALSWLATRHVLRLLEHRAILDRPNARSSHDRPTPRGGGLAIMAVLLPSWMLLAPAGADDTHPLAVALGAALLAFLSWRDDVGGLPAALRLAVQALIVAGGLFALPAGAVFQGLLPHPLDRALAGLLWLWFVNLFNFMDGIDGIAGSEAAMIAIGVALVALAAPVAGVAGLALLGCATAAAALGFLWWNWHPARLFMGDVGSVPLGYLLGWLLLALAARGLWAPALILPLYFLADASWTLLRRLARGARIWEAHREHFYQRAVQAGRSHAAVVRRVILADLVLLGAALWAKSSTALPLVLAAAAVLILLADLSDYGRRRPAP
jgi:UDP-N-acetylmuramyl pentapeptide phosphotransferase/UDP-N-acetylglucosamine-1-phosphate transferase